MTPPGEEERPRDVRSAWGVPPAPQWLCLAGAETPAPPGGPLSPLQAVCAARGGLQAQAVGAGAQRHDLGGPELPHQQHGGLRGGEAHGAEGGTGWGAEGGNPLLSWGLSRGAQSKCPGSEGHLSPGDRQESLICLFIHSFSHSFLHHTSNLGGRYGQREVETRPVPCCVAAKGRVTW